MAVPESPPGWDALSAVVASARAELHAAAPDAESAAEVEGYVMRVVTGCLDDAFLAHLRTEHGLTRALPIKGGPNPDYLMWHAAIDPTRRYRLEGRLHDSERVGVGVYSISAGGVTLPAGYVAFDRHGTDPEGGFAVELAPGAVGIETPALGRAAADAGAPARGRGAAGVGALAPVRGTTRVEALALTPACRVLLVRVLHRAPQGRPCALRLSSADAVHGGGEPQAGAEAQARGRLHSTDDFASMSERALARAGQSALRSIRQFLEWSRQTSANPNRFTAPPAALADEVRGDPDTNYGLGYFELEAGQWLDVSIPTGSSTGSSTYWSLHAYSHWCESLPGAGVHDLNAVADPDGSIHARIGPAVPPGLTNRLDTRGRHRGVLIFRAIGASTAQLPQAQLRP